MQYLTTALEDKRCFLNAQSVGNALSPRQGREPYSLLAGEWVTGQLCGQDRTVSSVDPVPLNRYGLRDVRDSNQPGLLALVAALSKKVASFLLLFLPHFRLEKCRNFSATRQEHEGGTIQFGRARH